ncbi:putative SOS response-associated peptidase YedK [compost metagenome]
MADIHDRRPLVLAPEEARTWLDPHLSPKEAEEILHLSMPVEEFEWFAVGVDVGNVKNEGPGLISPSDGSA